MAKAAEMGLDLDHLKKVHPHASARAKQQIVADIRLIPAREGL